jgi:prevent-host-death family protein
MQFATVKEVRQDLKRLLQSVDAGEQVIITRRGKPVAVLSPFDLEADPKVEEPPLRPFAEAWAQIEEVLEQSQPAFSSWKEALAYSRARKSSQARSRSKSS